MTLHYKAREFLRTAAIFAIVSTVTLGSIYLSKGGLDSLLVSCNRKNEPIHTPITQPITQLPTQPITQLPMPTNADIMGGIETLLALGNEPAYDQGTDHRAEVLNLASKVYQALNDGRTLEQDNPNIKFLTNEEWMQKTSTPDYLNKRNARGFSDRESKNREIVVYIRGNTTVLEALRTVAHETGITHIRRTQDPKIGRSYYTNGDSIMLESAGYLSQTAFFRRMEEAGFNLSLYSDTEKNRNHIKYASEQTIWRNSEKAAYFDASGELKVEDGKDFILGMWYGPSVLARDTNFADMKGEVELRGRTTSENNMTLIKRLANMSPDDFPSHYKGLLNAKTYGDVQEWMIKIATSPERLNGTNTFGEKVELFPADVLP